MLGGRNAKVKGEGVERRATSNQKGERQNVRKVTQVNLCTVKFLLIITKLRLVLTS